MRYPSSRSGDETRSNRRPIESWSQVIQLDLTVSLPSSGDKENLKNRSLYMEELEMVFETIKFHQIFRTVPNTF